MQSGSEPPSEMTSFRTSRLYKKSRKSSNAHTVANRTDQNSKTTGTLALSYQSKVMVQKSATHTEQTSEETNENQRNGSIICDDPIGNVVMKFTSDATAFDPIISTYWDTKEKCDIVFLAPTEKSVYRVNPVTKECRLIYRVDDTMTIN